MVQLGEKHQCTDNEEPTDTLGKTKTSLINVVMATSPTITVTNTG